MDIPLLFPPCKTTNKRNKKHKYRVNPGVAGGVGGAVPEKLMKTRAFTTRKKRQ